MQDGPTSIYKIYINIVVRFHFKSKAFGDIFRRLFLYSNEIFTELRDFQCEWMLI